MNATTSSSRGRSGVSAAFTATLSVFAALMLVTVGAFQALEGLAVLIHGDFFVVSGAYAYSVDVTAWGVLHLLLGVAAVVLGVALLQGRTWARVAATALAVVSAVAHFLFIPYYPLWSILIIAFDVAVIWALAGYDPERL